LCFATEKPHFAVLFAHFAFQGAIFNFIFHFIFTSFLLIFLLHMQKVAKNEIEKEPKMATLIFYICTFVDLSPTKIAIIE
jgi:hypothetical protein